MPTRGRTEWLVDTSVAVALLVADHEHHTSTTTAVGDRRIGLAGHAAFETFSVLTRLPSPARRPPSVVAHMLAVGFPGTRHLSAATSVALLDRVADAGVTGGAIYDALVGATAAEHRMVLATRDRRALDTYRIVGATVELLTD